jgi:hypothetical protein
VKKFLAAVVFFTLAIFSENQLHAQQYAIQQEGEFGIGLGAGH